MGRHGIQRPSSAVIAWRPQNPFLTYEKTCLTNGEIENFTNKSLHAKVMNDRVQVNNQNKFVPEHLLPTDSLAWVKKEARTVGGRTTFKKSNSQEPITLHSSSNIVTKPTMKLD